MNEKQIEKEISKRVNDLAFWVDHLAERVSDIGVQSICNMQISWHRQRILDLKSMLFARHCDEQI